MLMGPKNNNVPNTGKGRARPCTKKGLNDFFLSAYTRALIIIYTKYNFRVHAGATLFFASRPRRVNESAYNPSAT
jgi:hypothetical protein